MMISCGNCGKFGLTAVYYEDFIESANNGYNERLKTFLQRHKSDPKRPLISYNNLTVTPEGFKNYTWSQLDQ